MALTISAHPRSLPVVASGGSVELAQLALRLLDLGERAEHSGRVLRLLEAPEFGLAATLPAGETVSRVNRLALMSYLTDHLGASEAARGMAGSLIAELEPGGSIAMVYARRTGPIDVSLERALAYHRNPPGKLMVVPTHPLRDQQDLSLAYTPAVGYIVDAIAEDPEAAWELTGRGNLIAVVTDGSRGLRAGRPGPLGGKPVMEGKAVLYQLAAVDAFDLELEVTGREHFIAAVAALEPTFGLIQLEDIAAPDCFYVMDKLAELLGIPIFHDDQYGTAVVAGAALLNALEIVGVGLRDAEVTIYGAGAAGVATARHLVSLGMTKEQLTLLDREGVVYEGRPHTEPYRASFARRTNERTHAEGIRGRHALLGVTQSRRPEEPPRITAEMIQSMRGEEPIVFPLANPIPETTFGEVRTARPRAIVATGRSDDDVQINNLLGFPGMARGALDVRAEQFVPEMFVAATRALADLARQAVPDAVRALFGGAVMTFGPEYFVPKALDPRVVPWVASAVAEAAIAAGVSTTQARYPGTAAYRESVVRRVAARRRVHEAVLKALGG